MTDSPIIFSAAMVGALRDGRKSMTRRVLKPQPYEFCRDFPNPGFYSDEHWSRLYRGEWPDGSRSMQSWRFAPGDRLWVREGWAEICGFAGYRAGHEEASARGPRVDVGWRSPIHMPRWASRLTLTVTDVRVTRVREISEEDARAEGFGWRDTGRPEVNDLLVGAPVPAFSRLWDRLHGPGAWKANPWVCALTFRTERRNIDAPAEWEAR